MFVAFYQSTVKLQEESGFIFSVASGQAVVDSKNISPEPSLLWARGPAPSASPPTSWAPILQQLGGFCWICCSM